MKVIRIYQSEGVAAFEPRFTGTFAEAKEVAHGVPQALRLMVMAEEVEVQTDKAGIVAMLNNEPIVSAPLRTWGITARGALKEES